MSLTADLTVVRNTSGRTQFFAFLGERGVVLADGEDAHVLGDLRSRWQNNKTMMDALDYALGHGLCDIIVTPAVYVYDTASTAVKVLGSSSGTPTASAPSYGSYVGAGP